MEMKNPPHPSGLIGDTLDELDVSIVAAAKGLGITRQQLHNLISGRSGITPEMAVKLEKAIGSTADTWLRMRMNYASARSTSSVWCRSSMIEGAEFYDAGAFPFVPPRSLAVARKQSGRFRLLNQAPAGGNRLLCMGLFSIFCFPVTKAPART